MSTALNQLPATDWRCDIEAHVGSCNLQVLGALSYAHPVRPAQAKRSYVTPVIFVNVNWLSANLSENHTVDRGWSTYSQRGVPGDTDLVSLGDKAPSAMAPLFVVATFDFLPTCITHQDI